MNVRNLCATVKCSTFAEITLRHCSNTCP